VGFQRRHKGMPRTTTRPPGLGRRSGWRVLVDSQSRGWQV